MTSAKLLQKLDKKNKGVNYNRAKKAEATVGGKQLPTSLEEEIAELVSAQLEENDDRLTFHIKGTVITPEEYKKLPVNFYFNFGEDRFNTADENAETFCGSMKHLGYDPNEFDDLSEFVQYVEEDLGNNQGMRFLYNTGRKQSQSGYTKSFLAGLPEDGQTGGKKRPAKDKDEMPELEAGVAVEVTGDYFGDGEHYTGTIQSYNEDEDEYEILFDDDGSTDMIPSENVSPLPFEPSEDEGEEDTEEADEDEEEAPELALDDAVLCVEDYFGDGQQYEGTVTGMNDDGTVQVEWEDGEISDVEPKDLELA